MIDLIWLRNWFDGNLKELESKDIQFSFSEVTKTAKPAQFVDITAKTHLARITLWETGECDFEIIENETAELVVFENQIIESEVQMSNFLTNCFSKLIEFK